MYYIFSEKGGRSYASTAKTIREKDKTRIEPSYLGRVVDLDKGIFYSRERGYFTYNIKTDEYGKVDESFVPPATKDKRKIEPKALDFGDAFFLDQLMWKSGLWEVVDKISWANKDTLHTMVLFYILSRLPNCYSFLWYKNNVAHLLYPDANMNDSSISDFLMKLGTEEAFQPYSLEHSKYIFENYSKDKNILLDTMGIPNKVRIFLTQTNIHNGEKSVESRLAIVAQKSTAIPLFWKLFPGNITDGNAFQNIKESCDAHGITIEGALLDAGYSSDKNLDVFYDEANTCTVDYITRPKSTASYFVDALTRVLPTLESAENFVQYEGRYLYLQREEVKVGKQKNRPAYLYIGMDLGRLSDEMHKLLKRARKDNLPIEKVHAELENQGLFSLVSGYKYETEEILPEYYLRQGIEQLNDVVQNYTKLLPVRCHTKESFVGHVNLSMIGSTIVRFIQIQMNEDEMYLGSRFEALRCQKCILYNTKLVPDVPMKLANDLYRVFKMTSPTSIPISDGRLMSERPKSVSHFFKVPKKRIVKNGRMGKDAHVETDADSTENGEAGEQQGQNEATSK